MGGGRVRPQSAAFVAGKTTSIVALVAALLVGGAASLVGWFNRVGATVSAPTAATQLVEPPAPFLSV